MAAVKNTTPVQMPGTAPPTPQVVSYVVRAARVQAAPPSPGQPPGFLIVPTIVALAADGTVVNPPLGWVVPADVNTAYQAACQAALDAIGPVQLKGVLVTTGGYNGP